MMLHMRFIALLAFVFSSSCSSIPKGVKEMETPFSYVDQHFILVPVKINGSIAAKFVLDTGIGVNLISTTLCKRINCETKGSHTGKRMSGQELTLPISEVSELSFGDVRKKKVPVGIFDMEQLMPGSGVDGFLSIGFFNDTAFTVNYQKQTISIETDSTLERIRASGSTIAVHVDEKGVSTSIHLPLILPNGTKISTEVDTGSQALILHEKYMPLLGVKKDAKDVRHKQGKDETGHVFDRYFTTLSGAVHLPDHPTMKVEAINTMFQKIIYDGLVGHFFLKEFTVTYNLKQSEMIFQKP